MTRPDDLAKGQYITLVECLDVPAYSPFDWRTEDYRAVRFDGCPLEVLAVSLPFLCVTDGFDVFAVDTRAWRVQRVSKEYAAAMATARRQATTGAEKPLRHRRGSVFAAKSTSPKRDHRDCPRCGERMAQVRGIGSHPAWTLICKNCGHNGGPVTIIHP
jgi:predicted RNA-binding Zn-ribbon protein involved in translation (DUF1610 family)